LASRIMRSTGNSRVVPAPPRSWTASVVTRMAVSVAKSLAMDEPFETPDVRVSMRAQAA
jgi:hypothetical protein